MKILLLEDDNAIRSVLLYILTKNGHEVSACMLLREAAVLLADNPFDLIISDMGLPDGSGLDFCSAQMKTPFVIMSGSECSALAKSGGAKGFIRKPFDVEDILNIVNKIAV